MENLKISLVHISLLEVECSLVFLKHIEGTLSMPEKAIDDLLEGKLKNEYGKRETEDDSILISCNGEMPFQSIYIVNFQQKDLPFSYSSIDKYARKIIDVMVAGHPGIPGQIKKVATAVHGPGAGLDASEAMETFLMALANELSIRTNFGELEEIIFVEKDKSVFERLEERIRYLASRRIIKISEGTLYLLPMKDLPGGNQEKNRVENLSLKHIFIAMPYAKEFNNVYYFGIKQTVERYKRKSERTDQDQFVGDVVQRIKERIKNADLVIADITGHNPNVFYEVGVADGFGKKIILISQAQDIPFDFKNQRQIIYDSMDVLELSTNLGEMLDALL
jgi:hypothetical protein